MEEDRIIQEINRMLIKMNAQQLRRIWRVAQGLVK